MPISSQSNRLIFSQRNIIAGLFLVILCFSYCSEPKIVPAPENTEVEISEAVASNPCNCKYVVPLNTNIIDGAALGIKPGDVIGLDATKAYGAAPLRFINIVGSASQPVIIKNCNGAQAKITVPSNLTYVMKFENSKYFRVTGGNTNGAYGIKLAGSAILGLSMDKLTTNFEVDHIEVSNVGFAGIMAKTDPTCDNATIRGNFTLKDARIHHNYVHDTGGEGLYIGNSFYSNGVSTPCGTRLPHDLEYIKIYSNVVKHTGWEAIQLGGAVKGSEVYDNVVENYGKANVGGQNNGIQIGEGSGGLCYNNYIKTGPGNGLIVLGIADNIVFNNIIINAGAAGIFCDDRFTLGNGFKFINNTIVNPAGDGIRIYADKTGLTNIIKNNLISNPGTYITYETDNTPRTGQDAYVYKLNSNVKVVSSNNFNTQLTYLANYLSVGNLSAGIASVCQIRNMGCSPGYGVTFDFKHIGRPNGGAYDIGAVEYP